MYLLNPWGPAIIAYRHDKGLTQETFAELLNVSVRTVLYWEHGRIPSLSLQQKLLKLEDIESYLNQQ